MRMILSLWIRYIVIIAALIGRCLIIFFIFVVLGWLAGRLRALSTSLLFLHLWLPLISMMLLGAPTFPSLLVLAIIHPAMMLRMLDHKRRHHLRPTRLIRRSVVRWGRHERLLLIRLWRRSNSPTGITSTKEYIKGFHLSLVISCSCILFLLLDAEWRSFSLTTCIKTGYRVPIISYCWI